MSASTYATATIPPYGMSCKIADGTLISIVPTSGLRIEIEMTKSDGFILDDNSYGMLFATTFLSYGDNGQSGGLVTIKNLPEKSLEQATIIYENDLLDLSLNFSGCQAQ